MLCVVECCSNHSGRLFLRLGEPGAGPPSGNLAKKKEYFGETLRG